ncbi:MAG: formimidoylglutamate deiminase, partial [Candidatus Eremiobacteraeota bacterium]|nr:formimidoylglutamate deiminase [Candidatus Eremiobacteraeota bacterium]
MRLFAAMAFLPGGWAPDVGLEVAPDGTIGEVQVGAEPGDAEVLDGPVLAGMPNLHAHAFQ